jgi:hypothetical protein
MRAGRDQVETPAELAAELEEAQAAADPERGDRSA